MRNGCRALVPAVAAVVGLLTVGADAVRAQTVYVRQAPPASPVEIVLNGKPVASGTADANGDAILPLNLSALIGRAEMDANVLVDVCGELRRVLISDRGMRPPVPDPGCDRREIIGVFLVRRVTSLVVNVGGVNPTVLLVQGSYDLRDPRPARAWGRAPRGLVLFGGAGFGRVRDAERIACGTLDDCSADGALGAFNAGATFWIASVVGAEVSYLRPAQFDIRGSGEGFRFTSAFDVEMATIAGTVGVPVGAVRMYGKIGTNYQRSTFSTTQSHDPQTIVVDGVEQTIQGTSQTLVLNTSGWGWYYGGGVETWITRSIGLYGEVTRATLKGEPDNGGEGLIDDALTSVFLGLRVRIGR
jgi:hypothetical protein